MCTRYIANETVYFTDSGSLPVFTNSTLECPHTFSNNKVKMFWKVFHQNSPDNMDINIHSDMKWQAHSRWEVISLTIVAFMVHKVSEIKILSARDSRGSCNNFIWAHKIWHELDALRTSKYMHHRRAHKILKRGDLTQDSSHGKQFLHV